MVASKLNKLRDYLEKRQTREALVIRRGRIVAEWYWRGATRDTPLHVFSVTKSMTSSAMGLLVGDGMLKLDQSASDFIPAWKDDGRTAITIRHLVSMTSGTRNEEIGYSFTQTQLAQSLKQPLGSTPGTKWEYNNIARNALGEIVAKASGFDLGDFLQKRLYAPHGVKQPCESEIV